LTYKKIIDQFPGYTIYQGESPGHVYHYFSDVYCCPITKKTKEIIGKGALCNRISAFLFSKLSQLNIPNHFLSSRNMRESLVQATNPLPFSLRIHNRASLDLSKTFHVPEDTVFDPPLIEYITPSEKYHANDDFLMAMGWVDQDEVDELQALALRTTHCLQGLFVAFDLSLIEIQLTVARSFDDPFLVAGPLSPENFLVRDLRTGDLWTMSPSDDAHASCPLTPYIMLAQRLGLYPEDLLDISEEEELGFPIYDRNDHSIITGKTNSEAVTTEEVKKSIIETHKTPWPKNVLPFPSPIVSPFVN
jgi:phosphoribosylaminoimidazole-succinocarboxamide synthase